MDDVSVYQGKQVPHQDLVSVEVNVLLRDGDGAVQDVVARPEQVAVQNLVVFDYTESASEVWHCGDRAEQNVDPFTGAGLDGPCRCFEAEHVGLVVVPLEAAGEVGVVYY